MSVQQQFELLAKDIMDKAAERMKFHIPGDGRVRVLKDMKSELMALKDAYEGLLSMPITEGTFAEVIKLEICKS